MRSNREEEDRTLVDITISLGESNLDTKEPTMKILEIKSLSAELFNAYHPNTYADIITVEVTQGVLVLHDKAELFQNSKIRCIIGRVKLTGDCSRMFYGAKDFDDSITGWDLDDLTDHEDIFTGTLNDPNGRALFRRQRSRTENTVDTSHPDRWFYPQHTEGSTGIKFTDELSYSLISGPVSLKYYESKNNRTAFLIFGDVHASHRNMCDMECTSENSCTNLHDDDFLKALHNLAGDDRKARRINFCVEASKTAIINSLAERNSMRQMAQMLGLEDQKEDGNLKECIFKIVESEGIYDNVTIIGLDNRNEGNEHNIMQHFSKLFHIFINYLNGRVEPVRMHRGEWNRGLISQWLHNGFETDGVVHRHPMIKLVKDFLDLLENECKKTGKVDYITRELRTQRIYDSKRTNDFWAHSVPYGFYEKNECMKHLRRNNDQQDLQNILDCCIEGQQVEPEYKKTAEHLSTFFLYFGALIHDIRLVAYLLNQEAKEQVLTLNIIYYGDVHTVNINSILEHIPGEDSYTNYVSVNKLKDDSTDDIAIVNRCINLDDLNVFIDLKGFFDQEETVPKLMNRPVSS